MSVTQMSVTRKCDWAMLGAIATTVVDAWKQRD